MRSFLLLTLLTFLANANSLNSLKSVNSLESVKVETASYVDLKKYLGKWYEIASIPQSFQKNCVSNASAEYSLAEENLIKVLNSCETSTGEIKVIEGRAKVIDTQSNSKLKVTFVKASKTWIFLFGGNYWILDLDNDYTYAVVGDPSRKYAWILSRTPDISVDKLIAADKNLKRQGYDTCKLITTIQSGGLNSRKSLCEVIPQ